VLRSRCFVIEYTPYIDQPDTAAFISIAMLVQHVFETLLLIVRSVIKQMMETEEKLIMLAGELALTPCPSENPRSGYGNSYLIQHLSYYLYLYLFFLPFSQYLRSY
jgi:hypothetical protein